MMGTSRSRFTALSAPVLLLFAAGCGASTSTVSIDLRGMVEEAALGSTPLDRVVLRVSAADMPAVQTFDISIDNPIFDIELPSGPKRLFQIEGLAQPPANEGSTNLGAEVTFYFGRKIIDLPSRAIIDLVIPVFPAGRVAGDVRVADQTALPQPQLIRFSRDPAIAELVGPLAAVVTDARFVRPLPAGSYKAEIFFERGGVKYEPPTPVTLTIEQGQQLELGILLAPPGFCAPEAGLLPDFDNDGATCDVDCNDGDAAMNLDDVDQDGASTCDGDCDDNSAAKNINDVDRDGVTTCDGDCDDDPLLCGARCGPGFAEVCDGDDNDCDGSIDNGVALQWFPDNDGDGVGNNEGAVSTCIAPDGFVAVGGDCDDDPQACGANCYPGNLQGEVCDGFDNDCDGTADDGGTVSMWYPDADKDGYGTDTGAISACVPPLNYAPVGGDCNDNNALVHPGALEIGGDHQDSDCDGMEVCFEDNDGDGNGSRTIKMTASIDCPATENLADNGWDCDDGLATFNFNDVDGDGEFSCISDCDDSLATGAQRNDRLTEQCGDGIDNDCDGLIDSADNDCTQCPDNDGDGYACGDCDDNPASGALMTPADNDNDGYSACDPNPDCDDTNPMVGPHRAEFCGDSIDNDCDGSINEGCTVDADGDGYPADVDCDDQDPNVKPVDNDKDGFDQCPRPCVGHECNQWGVVPADCDDTQFFSSPFFVSEQCFDGIDNDCDGLVDAYDADCDTTVCTDNDNDGFMACPGGGDCDDTPDQGEFCFAECRTLYRDLDGDGFGDNAQSVFTCELPGYVENPGDCDDNPVACGANCYPGNQNPPQSCTLDTNCDGNPDEVDMDGDGYSFCAAGPDQDCNDADPWVVPADLDGDGFDGCDPMPAQVDCEPFSSLASPGHGRSDEVCDGLDNDCNGFIDDVAGVGIVDQDGDGWPDCIDNCPNAPDQNPLPAPTVYLEVYSACSGPGAQASYQFELNGNSVGPPMLTDSVAGCECTSSPQIQLISGVGTFWNNGYTDMFRVIKTDNGDTEPLWINLRLDFGSDIQNICLFGPCGDDPPSFCYSSTHPPMSADFFAEARGRLRQTDMDNDGAGPVCDCDDNDSARSFRQSERCNDGIDNDCDGQDDINDATDCPSICAAMDNDLDGYYAAGGGCTPPFIDCNDSDALTNPGIKSETRCADGKDDDCDNNTDLADLDCTGFDPNGPLDLGALLVNTPNAFAHGRLKCFSDQPFSSAPAPCSLNQPPQYFIMQLNDPNTKADYLEFCNHSPYVMEVSSVTAAGTEFECLQDPLSQTILGTIPQGCSSIPMSGTQNLGIAVRWDNDICLPGGGADFDLRYIDADTCAGGPCGPSCSGSGCSGDPCSIDIDVDGTPDCTDPCVDADMDGYGRDGF
ncbi:MAG: MopE-related protein [Myxococcota bacterium]